MHTLAKLPMACTWSVRAFNPSHDGVLWQGLSKDTGLGEVLARLAPRYASVKALAARLLRQQSPITGTGAPPMTQCPW